MRVIAGSAGGIHLKFPKGAPTRPATDLVRGALFSILENMSLNWDNVLDLFSGTGAMGIEALSRGANSVDFVDRDRRCCAIIKENLEAARLAEKAHVHCTSVARALSFLDKEYDIIIMDPPYPDTSIGNVIEQLAVSKLVGDTTTLVVTHSPHLQLSSKFSGLNQVLERRHGDSIIAIYQKEAQA